ncbi:MAG: hypothetical protein IPL23_02875 [Saprospiraceae bacterium]|nr:hypothetical protein [Saprospiraceae bacterium]
MRHIKKIFAIGVTASLLLTSACTDLVNEERDSIVLPVTTDGFAKYEL